MNGSLSAERRRKTILSVVLAFICILYILPVLAVVVNSFKLNTYVKTETFALPAGQTTSRASPLATIPSGSPRSTVFSSRLSPRR